MNADMMKFLATILALMFIYFLIGCETYREYNYNKSILDQHKLDTQQFINEHPDLAKHLMNYNQQTNE
jgi:hypothetical protein